MNSYRFVSGQEPSDEMLSQIMKEVAEEAASSNKRTKDMLMSEMINKATASKAQWVERINNIING